MPKPNNSIAAVEKRIISLPAEQAAYIDTLVAEGTYAFASEVVPAGLRALRNGAPPSNAGCANKSPPTYDAMAVDPSRAIPAERFFRTPRRRHAKRLKAKRGA